MSREANKQMIAEVLREMDVATQQQMIKGRYLLSAAAAEAIWRNARAHVQATKASASAQ